MTGQATTDFFEKKQTAFFLDEVRHPALSKTRTTRTTSTTSVWKYDCHIWGFSVWKYDLHGSYLSKNYSRVNNGYLVVPSTKEYDDVNSSKK